LSRRSNTSSGQKGTRVTLQNRVDPLGEICASDARGMFTGNRGIIHDPDAKTLLKRRWSTKAWIICVCAFGGRRREVMGRNGRNGGAGWTELFFLDEVTALAAGHRPCFFCQRERATAFRKHFPAAGTASKIDDILHRERRASGGKPVPLSQDEVLQLPNGAMVEVNRAVFAALDGRFVPWSFHGYSTEVPDFTVNGMVHLVTPASTVAALANGYQPIWHDSARA
jgi:hypothetical protein